AGGGVADQGAFSGGDAGAAASMHRAAASARSGADARDLRRISWALVRAQSGPLPRSLRDDGIARRRRTAAGGGSGGEAAVDPGRRYHAAVLALVWKQQPRLLFPDHPAADHRALGRGAGARGTPPPPPP